MVLYGLVKWNREMEINKTAQRRHEKKDEKKLFYQQNREVNFFFKFLSLILSLYILNFLPHIFLSEF